MMKKIYALATLMAFGGALNAQQALNREAFSKAPRTLIPLNSSSLTSSGNHALPTSLKASAALLSEDFESVSTPDLPNGWTHSEVISDYTAYDGGFFTGDYTDAVAAGWWPVTDHSTFVMTNDDVCNCDKLNEYLELPVLDFTGETNIGMYFSTWFSDVYGGYEYAEVQASTDTGNSWTTIYTVPDKQDWVSYIVDLSAYDNAPSLTLRFHYSDNGSWGTGIAIDDILVKRILDNDIAISNVRPTMGQVYHDYYYLTPVSLFMPTTTISADVENMGLEEQTNVSLNVEVTIDDPNVLAPVFSEQVAASGTNVAAGAVDSFFTSSYTPVDEGSYTVNCYISQSETDEDSTNNTFSYNFEVGDTVFARENGVEDDFVGPLWYGVNQLDLYSFFWFENEGEITSASAYISNSGNHTDGGAIQFTLYEVDLTDWSMSGVATTALYDVPASAAGTWVTLPLQGGAYYASAGTAYYLATSLIGSNSAVDIVMGSNKSVIYDQYDLFSYADAEGDLYYFNAVPMARLNLGNAATSGIFNSEVADFNLGQNMPNPANDLTTIEYTLDAGADNVAFEVVDLTGKVVYAATEGSKMIGSHKLLFNTAELSSGSYFYSLEVDGVKATKKMSIMK